MPLLRFRPSPLLVVAALVAIGGVLGGLVMLAMLQDVQDDARNLGTDGSIAQDLTTLRHAVGRMDTFASDERLRRIADPQGDIPTAQLLEADATVTSITELTNRVVAHPQADDDLRAQARELRLAFLSYLNEEQLRDLDLLHEAAADMERQLNALDEDLSAAPAAWYALLVDGIERVRYTLIILVVTVIPFSVGLIWWVGRRYRRALELAMERESSLAASNRSLARRNDQFAGLYQVVSEVTETLSMKYVVQTTLREARKLAGADLVALYVLEDDRLALAGAETADGDSDHSIAEDVELGQGLIGRAAKRGRTMVYNGHDEVRGHDTALPEAQSGLIVPLIVGARVVGVVSCWSHAPTAFSADDERVLELMASQVATAIAAADVYEASDRYAHRDALTELPNRRQLAEDTRYEFDRAVMRGRRLSVAVVDVDFFKAFNDRFGHRAGDIALQQIATTLAGELRDEDRVYRYGGEEFAIVLDSLTPAQAEQVAERLRAAVARVQPVDGQHGSVTISIGLTHAPGNAATFDELLAAADQALYMAKEGGRNRVVVFPPPVETAAAAA